MLKLLPKLEINIFTVYCFTVYFHISFSYWFLRPYNLPTWRIKSHSTGEFGTHSTARSLCHSLQHFKPWMKKYNRITHVGEGTTYAAQRTIQSSQKDLHAIHAVQKSPVHQ